MSTEHLFTLLKIRGLFNTKPETFLNNNLKPLYNKLFQHSYKKAGHSTGLSTPDVYLL